MKFDISNHTADEITRALAANIETYRLRVVDATTNAESKHWERRERSARIALAEWGAAHPNNL